MRTESEIGRLVSVAVREVWADEARDFTPWLAENLDALSTALGMDLALEGTEVRVGPFNADLVLQNTDTNDRVVVENLLEATDHDHLGKMLTYAAGLEATHAVLIAERFRAEHLSAIQWLNTHSAESVGFFGIELKVWHIGDSLPAPQLDVVAKPDQWVRGIHRARELTSLELDCRDFWSAFLPSFHEKHPGWSRADTPSKKLRMKFPAGKAGTSYRVGFCRTEGRHRFRVGLHIKEQAPVQFEELRSRRTDIEAALGETAQWGQMERSAGNRIAVYFPEDVRVRERERWTELRTWGIERMGAFRQALQPHLDTQP